MSMNDWVEVSIKEKNPEAITSAIQELQVSDTEQWKEKLLAAAIALDEREKLEALGKGLNAALALELFANLPHATKKLSPILFGMPHPIFREILLLGKEEPTKVLKQETLLEPIQHQVLIFIQELQKRLRELNTEYGRLDIKLQSLDPKSLTKDELHILWQKLTFLSAQYQELMHETSIVLVLAWAMAKEDLISRLTDLKEESHRISHFGVGFPATDKEKASGLFALLDEKVFAVFGSSNQFSALQDDDPALDGLMRFTSWYLKDWWALGLLPQIEKAEELESDQELASEGRKKLLAQVEDNLSLLGLKTIKDLKQAWIYSKESLEAFIAAHRTNLKRTV